MNGLENVWQENVWQENVWQENVWQENDWQEYEALSLSNSLFLSFSHPTFSCPLILLPYHSLALAFSHPHVRPSSHFPTPLLFLPSQSLGLSLSARSFQCRVDHDARRVPGAEQASRPFYGLD